AERWPELLSLVGQPAHLGSKSVHACDVVGSRDRHAARSGRIRDGYQQAPAVLLENSANPARPVADTRNGAPATVRVVEKFVDKLSAQGLGPVQAGVDRIQGRLNIRRITHVEISGR